MQECGKSIPRRLADPKFHTRYFVGNGLDIGGAPDPLGVYGELFARIDTVEIWDLPEGDAQYLAGKDDESYNFVHSSHCLEHMRDPAEALTNWFRVVKPGGHLIVTVPDEDLYEQGVFPSRHNTDHKWTFTISKARSWSAKSQNVLELIAGLGRFAEIAKVEILDGTYRYSMPAFDQTLTPVGESGIEFIIRKRVQVEIDAGGRLPVAGEINDELFTMMTGLSRLKK